MDVLAVDVERYGPRDAVVLAALRDLGCSVTVPIVISAAKIGRFAGLHRDAVRRSLWSLRRHRAVKVVPGRQRTAGIIRIGKGSACDVTPPQAGQRETMRQGVGSISQPPHNTGTRLSTLRALLAVSG